MPRRPFAHLALLCLGLSSVATAGRVVHDPSELPAGSFPAYYHWVINSARVVMPAPGFGGRYPGLRTTKGTDLSDYGAGHLGRSYGELAVEVRRAEAHLLATDDNRWWRTERLWLKAPIPYNVTAGSGPRWWVEQSEVTSTGPGRTRTVSGGWNLGMYSARACPEAYDFTVQEEWNSSWGRPPTEIWCTPRPDTPDPERNLGPSCPTGGTNPINLATGNKYHREPVYAAGGPAPIRFVFHYNSRATGDRWTHSYGAHLSSGIADTRQALEEGMLAESSPYLMLEAHRDDGRVVRFTNVMDWAALTTGEIEWRGPANARERLRSIVDPESGALVGLRLLLPDGGEERYDLSGRLLTRSDPRGDIHWLEYDAGGRLVGVRNAYVW